MKFYSEKLNKLFDSQEELEAAESSKTVKKCKKKVEDSTPATPSRKELAAAVDEADEHVKRCYADYEQAKLKAQELSKKYLAEVAAIIDPAKKAVKDAENARYDAIRKFNETYGAYQVTYTGDKAAQEFFKAVNNINATTLNIFKDILWF